LEGISDIVNHYGSRGLGYAIYSMIVEKEPLVIIIDKKEFLEPFTILLEEIHDRYEIRKPPTSEVKLAPFEIVTREEYFKRWREFAGKRLIFIKEDKNIICPGLDLLEKILDEIFLSGSKDPVMRIAIRITDILSSIEIAKEYYREFKKGSMSVKKFYSLLEKRFPKRDDAHLLVEILRSFY